jgi:hypothetical protein
MTISLIATDDRRNKENEAFDWYHFVVRATGVVGGCWIRRRMGNSDRAASSIAFLDGRHRNLLRTGSRVGVHRTVASAVVGSKCIEGATVAELCRLAGVSRNSVYRYHPDILAALRLHQRGSAPHNGARHSHAGPAPSDNTALQDQVSKLAALVDHYYAAYREARVLLDRRDRELSELRRKLDAKPVPVSR